MISWARPSRTTAPPLSSVSATLNAFWEVDLWGRIRRLNESARAQFLASEEARRGVRLSLLSDVATAYFQLLELDQELEIASRTTNSFAESLRIFNQRVEGGTASALQSSRAEAALDDAAAAVPAIRERISATENQLCILLGRNPGPIERPHRCSRSGCRDIPAGLPSSLLERRPDLRQAEQLLRSANAQVGESVAEFFPKIGLTAFLGKVSPELSAFTLGSANAWGIAAEGTGPLFEGGRLVGQYRQAKAARMEAELQYRQTILNAFEKFPMRWSRACNSLKFASIRRTKYRAGDGGEAFHRAVCSRQGRLLRGSGSAAAAFPRTTQPGPHPTRSTPGRGLALQSAGRRLAGRNETKSAQLNGYQASSRIAGSLGSFGATRWSGQTRLCG